MLVIKVELHSAITKRVTEIARIDIANMGTSLGSIPHTVKERCDYRARLWLEGGSEIDQEVMVKGYERNMRPVWDLVTKALQALGFGK